MLPIEQRIKNLDSAKDLLDRAIKYIYTAGVKFDQTLPEEKTERFFKLRWQLEQQKQQIKILTSNLRVSQAKKDDLCEILSLKQEKCEFYITHEGPHSFEFSKENLSVEDGH